MDKSKPNIKKRKGCRPKADETPEHQIESRDREPHAEVIGQVVPTSTDIDDSTKKSQHFKKVRQRARQAWSKQNQCTKEERILINKLKNDIKRMKEEQEKKLAYLDAIEATLTMYNLKVKDEQG